MIVRNLTSILGTDRHVTGEAFESRRILLADDGLGYSLHDTVVKEGNEQHLQYKNHIESNYCVEGEGEVVNVATGEVHPLGPGSLYTLDKHDAHILRATRGDMRLICVFTPALSGHEVHDDDGGYPASE
ncbi:ectoine synthase [Pseudohalocynthiibacter aestuariivivens]|jgi:L-ectoine synthase|uniref:L-ectoine synthase n=1 Tax=Pseudohalocynthiibacter aestuariivivens TaxID=1591409 RepID=A0ABV5JLZ4_9RHOB|nr:MULTISPECIES: ectoine synthase [Pseudohalocynthiibacter]MBS9715534.1 ectoine synthase [Pseudohalocynthiibacter aestuariivivens]MCK0101133.1 ectoine synthase [Pseudohalocynthiibacter sp. F2068]